MKLFLATALLMFVKVMTAQSAELPLVLTSVKYTTYDTDVYDGQTGKTFPYRIILIWPQFGGDEKVWYKA